MRIVTRVIQTFIALRIIMRMISDIDFMDSPTVNIGRVTTGKGRPTNLYIRKQVVKAGNVIAKAKYGCSLSQLVEKLILKEAKREERKRRSAEKITSVSQPSCT